MANQPLLPLSIALFVLLGTWQGSFNGVRQYLAAAIIFAGHSLILNRRFKLFLLVVLMAALFHISALVCLAFYFVPLQRTQNPTPVAVLVHYLILIVTLQGGILDALLSVRSGPTGVPVSDSCTPSKPCIRSGLPSRSCLLSSI